MTGLRILMLAVLLVGIPIWIGGIFTGAGKHTDRQTDKNKLTFQWISGQLVLWAGFQLLCVPVVLMQKSFRVVVGCFNGYTIALMLLAAVFFYQRRRKTSLHVVREPQKPGGKWYYISWGVFWALLAFQLLQAVVMAYADGDDAFYIAEATHAVDSELMYDKIPYTGWPTELDARHGIAPFPIWIAYLSKMSGIRTVTVAHVLLPLAMIPLTYAVYYQLGSRLFARKKDSLPVFMIFTELLVLFGDYSLYTAEHFMIARSRQGKAALASIVIPALFLLLLLLLEKLQEEQRIPLGYWVLLVAALTASCLCSTLGALLVCMLVGVTGLCAAVCYRKWKLLIPMAACCIPCLIYVGLYLVLG